MKARLPVIVVKRREIDLSAFSFEEADIDIPSTQAPTDSLLSIMRRTPTPPLVGCSEIARHLSLPDNGSAPMRVESLDGR